mgnify:CR=1 FL=1
MNSLGFAKPPSKTRVVAAMSGGVDSSVVAAMLKREGYDVIGVTLQLYDHGAAVNKPGACCAGQDIHDARRVADGRISWRVLWVRYPTALGGFGAIGLVLTACVIGILATGLGVTPVLAKVAAVVASFFVVFVLRRSVVFAARPGIPPA